MCIRYRVKSIMKIPAATTLMISDTISDQFGISLGLDYKKMAMKSYIRGIRLGDLGWRLCRLQRDLVPTPSLLGLHEPALFPLSALGQLLPNCIFYIFPVAGLLLLQVLFDFLPPLNSSYGSYVSSGSAVRSHQKR